MGAELWLGGHTPGSREPQGFSSPCANTPVRTRGVEKGVSGAYVPHSAKSIG